MMLFHFCMLVVFVVSLAACQQPGTTPPTQSAVLESREPAPPDGVVRLAPEALRTLKLNLARVERRPLIEAIRVTAVIKPNEDRLAHVSPRIPGRVVQVRKFLGDVVKEGDVLAFLDSVELGRAEADYLKFQALSEIQEKNYQREKRLFEQKISSQKEVLAAEAAYRSVKAEFEAAHTILHLYGLSPKEVHTLSWQAKERISRFPLISPFSGIVAEKDLTIGEVIAPDRSVYTIANFSTVWIQLDVYEKDLAKVQPGQDVVVATESYPAETFQGTVTYIGSLFNEATRTVPTRVEIPNPQGRLKPGMFATATIAAHTPGVGQESQQEVPFGLTIPQAAVQRIASETIVFVPSQEGVFTKPHVTLGQNGDGWVEVRIGLQEGEQVVTDGSFTLKSELLKATLAG